MRSLILNRYCQLTLILILLVSTLGMPLKASEPGRPLTQANPQQLSALPDLVVESIVLSPADFVAGSDVDIIITVKNQGDARAGTFILYLYVNPADNPPITTTAPSKPFTYGLGIAPGGRQSFVQTNQPMTQSAAIIYAWVDRDNKVAESNETNNLYTFYSGGTPDSYEDDDSCLSAKPIIIDGAAQEHNFSRQPEDIATGNEDYDWVAFDAIAGTEYLVTALATGSGSAPIIKSVTTCDNQSLGGGNPVRLKPQSNTRYMLEISNSKEGDGKESSYQLSVRSEIACADQPEENNSCTNSALLTTDPLQSAFCASRDVDWYRFPVVAGGRYTVTASNIGSDANLQMRLFESCSAGGSENSLQQNFIASQPGWAYLQLQQTKTGINTDYSLLLKQDLTTGCDVDAYDKAASRNDQRESATPITVGNPQTHNSCPANDPDWVRFATQAGKNYTIETFQLANKADTTLCLYDATGEELQCDDDSGEGSGSRIYLQNSSGGDYFARALQLDEEVAGPATQYQMQLLEGECQADQYEPDDQRSQAKAIDPANPTHNICQRHDVDWIQFNATAQTSYIIESKNLGADADTILELYNNSGTLLASNDDFSPGIQSRINYTVSAAGTYFVKVRLYNATKLGEGSRYTIDIRTGIAPPLPPQSYPPSAGDWRPPTSSTGTYRTLILFNYDRIATLYSVDEADLLLQALNQLANDPKVQGEIIRLEQYPEVRDAYTNWLADMGNIGKANQVADSIRNLINRIRQSEGKLEYLVLAGDDRAIPFYRILDDVPDTDREDVEEEYTAVNTKHPTGIALRSNYYLSDDYYATRLATVTASGSDLYIPDLALGRLIETPQDMINMIEHYLANPVSQVKGVLVTGFDFASDVAQENCAQWQTYQNNSALTSCSLIGDAWTKQLFDTMRLGTIPAYNIQSINGHAAHFADASPNPQNSIQTADELLSGIGDIRGGLIYSLGCHGGLNVPPANSGPVQHAFGDYRPLDLPEAAVRRGANYIGNTGYGYGQYGLVSHSEKLMAYLTKEILQQPFGKALVASKQQFFSELLWDSLTPYEKKSAQELAYYGLPMYRIPASTGSLGNEFPGVVFSLANASLGSSEVISRSARLDLSKGKFRISSTANGDYTTLSNHATMAAKTPVQPVFYGTLPELFRSVVMRGGVYSITTGVNPVVATPINEFSLITTEWNLATTVGWIPDFPLTLQSVTANESTIVAAVKQFNTPEHSERQYSALSLDLLTSEIVTDSVPPFVLVVDGQLNEKTQQVNIKVGAVDASGIYAVIVVYFEEANAKQGVAQSFGLTYNAAQQKWIGSFPGNANSKFFVQVIDNAALTTVATDKGHYFTAQPVAPDPPPVQHIYLPLVTR